ncbi:MAG: histidine kinase, partial [Myxococcota bacterium]
TDGRRARVMVRDEGPGLPSDFDLRASESLGLQLVRTLTRQLNGVIEAKSDGGAVFELSFPL